MMVIPIARVQSEYENLRRMGLFVSHANLVKHTASRLGISEQDVENALKEKSNGTTA